MTDFLYPFIEGSEDDLAGLLADLATSAAEKATQSAALREATLTAGADSIAAAAADLARRLDVGGQILAFGNGGSSTDAASLVTLFSRPPHGRPFPARNLVEDSAVLTALGNDVGFSLVFSRQVIAHGRAGDVAVGFSTSGNSDDVLVAFAEASRRGLLTIGFAGYDGGDMGRAGLDHCLVVDSDSVHRIQETQAALAFALWRAATDQLASVPSGG